VVSTLPRQLYPRERPGTHRTGSWVGPRAGSRVKFPLYIYTLIHIHILVLYIYVIRSPGLTYGSVAARVRGLWVRVPPGEGTFIPCECCQAEVFATR
jgi:hypothetical protein